jgi:hypothetical protein
MTAPCPFCVRDNVVQFVSELSGDETFNFGIRDQA